MPKIVIHSAGGNGKLQLEEQPDPTPGEGEMVVETAVIGVNSPIVASAWGSTRPPRNTSAGHYTGV